MKTTKRSWIIRIAFVLVLVLVAVLMLRIGRGHTVYFDNRAVDKGGQSVEAPYKITVYVNGEQLLDHCHRRQAGADRGGHAAERRQRDNGNVPNDTAP